MIIISNPQATSPHLQGDGAIVATIESGPSNYAPLAIIGSNQPTQAIALTLPTYTGTTAQIDVSSLSLYAVEAIEIAGIRYTQSSMPDNLQAGKFFWDSAAGTITLQFDA